MDATVENTETGETSFTTRTTQQEGMNDRQEASVLGAISEEISEEALRRQHEAMEIVIKAKESLKDEAKLESFFQIIQACQETPIQAFAQLHNLCQGLPELQELLLDLLTPEQALALDPIIYAQHCLRNDMKQFCQKVKNFFAPTAQSSNSNGAVTQGTGQSQATKIFKEIHNFISQDDHEITSEELRNFAAKWFKGNQQLIDIFVSFLPDQTEERERIWNRIEPEDIDLSDEEKDISSEINRSEQINLKDYEHIKDIPETEEERLFGTEQCPCQCHPKTPPITSHCIHCSIRFINGKIYAREGKILKPVKVTYPCGKNPFAQNDSQSASASLGTNLASPAINPTGINRNHL